MLKESDKQVDMYVCAYVCTLVVCGITCGIEYLKGWKSETEYKQMCKIYI